MTNYQKIKQIFSETLEGQSVVGVTVKNYHSKIDYIKDMYECISKEKFDDMKADVLRILDITRSELDAMLFEVICTNLCCDFSLILQILAGKGKRRELYIENYARTQNEDKTTKERIKRRLEPDRVVVMEELGVKFRDERFKAPTLMKAFVDIMFIQREGKDIIYLSDIFIDIFRSLFCDTNEKLQDGLYIKSIRDIKAYRLWKFTPDTIKYVVDIYKEIVEGECKYKIAELNFMEKLFGLMTLGEIASRKFKKEEAMCVTEGISVIRNLGYSSMTKLIMSKINKKNYHAYSNIITKYIYPLCSACICNILGDVIAYIGRLECKDRVKVIEDLVNACYINTMKIYDINVLESIRYNCKMYLFKILHGIPMLELTEKEHEEKYANYLKSLGGEFEREEYVEDEKITVFSVNNIGYEDLSYLQCCNNGDFFEELTDEEKYYRDM